MNQRKMEFSEKKDTQGYPITERPWRKFFSDEALHKPFPEQSINEWVRTINQEHPDEIALQYLGVNITYGEMFTRWDNTAKALKALGIKKGEIVTVAMPAMPEVVDLIYAINQIGAIVNLIHPLPGKEELAFYLNEVNSRYFFCFDGTYTLYQDIAEDTSVKQTIVVSPAASLPWFKRHLYRMSHNSHLERNDMEWEDFLKLGKSYNGPITEERDHNAPAILSHTGGTTGDPKAVMLSDNNENAEVFQIINGIPNERQKCMMVVLPPFVNYSFTNGIHEGLSVGCKVALLPKYEIGKYHIYQKQYHPNYINTIPAYVLAMLKEPEMEHADMSSIEFMVVGGEAMDAASEKTVNDFLHSHGAHSELQKGYGMTEMVSGITVTRSDINVPNSAGIPMFMAYATAVDINTNEPLPYNQKGELCFAGPTISLGYYHNDIATKKLIQVHKDGKRWLHTGDIGYIDEDGDIFITGRMKRIIMTKGEDGNPTKMFPDRVERTIQKVDAVNAVCVTGVKDEERIHIPVAWIELKDNTADKAEKKTIKKRILSVCQKHLPSYQVPAQVKFLDKLPRTPRGKIDYHALDVDSDLNR